MPRKERALLYDDPFHRRTRPDTNRVAAGETEDTRVDTVPAAERFAEESSPSHPHALLVVRELPLYPGISQTSLRRDEATVPDAPLGRGSPVAMQAAGQAPTTEHTAAPPSGTRNRGSAPELPPVPEPPPAARARELQRMMRLVTPLPTNEWTVAPNVHEWRDEWGARREVAEAAERRRRRLRLRTLLLVVVTLVAAAVIGTGLGRVWKSSATPPTKAPVLVQPAVRARIELPRRVAPVEAPAIPTVQIEDLPRLSAPVEEPVVAKKGSITKRKPRPARPPKRK